MKVGQLGWHLKNSLQHSHRYVFFVIKSWVLMNAIRWRIPDLMSASKAEYHLTGSLSKELAGTSEEILFSKTLQLQLVLSDEPRTNSALPYSPSEVCSDPILFTETGTTALGYPFGKFTKTSPIRPLCAAVSSVPGAMSNLGDFIVSTPLAVSRLNASAYVSIGSRALPEGFVAVTFTGHQSRFGVVESMIHIQSTPTTSINLITPQLQLNSTRFINSQADVGMLLVDPTSTGMHYISASEFNNDPKSPMRISVLVPGSGYFIFGRLSANTILPIRFGMALEYIGEWGVKMFQLDELQITITSTRDLSLVVTRADIVSSAKADVQNSYSVVINGELGDASVVLSGKFKRGYAWARYDASLNTVGGKWSASTMGSSITAEKSGIYGILNLGYASSTCAIAPMLMMPAVSLAAMYWGTL